MIKLNREQTEEAVRNPQGVECQGEGTEKVFVIVDVDVMQRMQEALAVTDHAAIQAGIDDMEAGRMMTLDEADAHIRSECGFPPRKGS
ncbi:hypothetical protein OAH18_00640 [bacterium]|nr:hypothetical protein [bacterium]